MVQAVSFALLDSINVLLIGVLVALGIIMPAKGRFRAVATVLILGDWLGVFALATLVTFIFRGLQGWVQSALESPIYGLLLIAVGVVSVVGAWRSTGGEAAMIGRLLKPLKRPSLMTALVGFVLGVVQSATSVPFYAGLLHLSALRLSTPSVLLGLVGYASLALSLPALSAVLVTIVRARPDSWAGRGFAAARAHSGRLTSWAGYGVGVILLVMGVVALV